MTTFRTWQALEPLEVVESIPLDSAFADFAEHVRSALDPQHAADILAAQALSLNHLLVRAVELAASAGDDWQRRAAFLDLAIRAQSESAAALIEARRLGGSGEQ